MEGSWEPNSDIKEAVRIVLEEGIRTLPSYVNEHAAMYAVANVSTYGESIDMSDHDDYISGVTKIHQSSMNGGSTFTYYSFPDVNSDVFGTTMPELVGTEQDACYKYEKVAERMYK